MIDSSLEHEGQSRCGALALILSSLVGASGCSLALDQFANRPREVVRVGTESALLEVRAEGDVQRLSAGDATSSSSTLIARQSYSIREFRRERRYWPVFVAGGLASGAGIGAALANQRQAGDLAPTWARPLSIGLFAYALAEGAAGFAVWARVLLSRATVVRRVAAPRPIDVAAVWRDGTVSRGRTSVPGTSVYVITRETPGSFASARRDWLLTDPDLSAMQTAVLLRSALELASRALEQGNRPGAKQAHGMLEQWRDRTDLNPTRKAEVEEWQRLLADRFSL